ncbi:MAG: hypothetical protein IJ013_06950 [Bacteroidaceae bacterium]|nr:hypothetical protein [Bacteroidaceae bacterium]
MLTAPVSSESKTKAQPTHTISLKTLERNSISIEESERRMAKLINDHFHSK